MLIQSFIVEHKAIYDHYGEFALKNGIITP